MTSEAAVKAFTTRGMICPLVAVPKDSFQETLALAVNKYFPFRRLLAHRIQTLRRSGQLAHHFARTTLATGPKAVVAEMEEKEMAGGRQEAVFRSAELLDVAAAAVALGFGATAAAMLMATEKLLYHVMRTHRTAATADHGALPAWQKGFIH